jgi:hypothetical protein
MVALASDSAILADHIEMIVLAAHEEIFNRRRIEEVADRLWQADAVQIGYAWDVMLTRQRVLADRYPLKVAKAYAVKSSEAVVYEALLAMTRSGWTYGPNGLDEVEMTKLFETLVERCLSNFFGPSTETVNFGWPSRVGRPAEFPRAVSWLAELIGIPVGTAYRQPRRKDGGVDVVVWRPMPDGRPGVPLMLVQATIQGDVQAKARDVDRRMWSGWLASDAEPLVVLAIPGTLTSLEDWNEVTRNSLLLDRVRLTGLAPSDDLQLQDLCHQIVARSRSLTKQRLAED